VAPVLAGSALWQEQLQETVVITRQAYRMHVPRTAHTHAYHHDALQPARVSECFELQLEVSQQLLWAVILLQRLPSA
jgi:hypothetical protein